MMDNRLSRSCSLIHARSRSLNINCDECYTSPSVYHSIYARRSLLSLSLSFSLSPQRGEGEEEGEGEDTNRTEGLRATTSAVHARDGANEHEANGGQEEKDSRRHT